MDTFFPTDLTGLPEALRPEVLELADGEELRLRPAPVAKRIGDSTVRMLAYNGSIPGPTLKVRQGSEIVVHVANGTDLDTTVHWHGLRLENRFDGVPHETQAPIPPGGEFTYRIQFPDPGLYWYHPHVREDVTQELGLYGSILVTPTEPDYWPPVHRDLVLTLDDLLLEDGTIAPFSRTETNYAAMGRYGNLMLTGGETDPTSTVRTGEVVRLWLTDTANSRVFRVGVPGARMKLVGGDSGRMEHEEFVDDVVLGPSERAVVDVLFDRAGAFVLEHRTPDRSYRLAAFTVTGEVAEPPLAPQFEVLRTAPELAAERERLQAWVDAPPDKVLAIVAEMDDPGASAAAGPVTYACPMHPEVVSDQPGRCPECGMKLMVTAPAGAVGHDMTHDDDDMGHDRGHGAAAPEVSASDHDAAHVHAHPHGSATADGIEWEDEMAEMNRATTTETMRWEFRDRTAGHDGPPVGWRFTVGQRVKIRLVNEMDSDHPMHHPFHVHGAGRFLVLARDEVPEPDLVWKDTVLVRTGQTVDLLLDVTNPGLWMAHCHIAEHMHAGMMFSFTVDRGATP
ncbi:Multicopper oxidase [Geodermatophilus amargosae]|uniref:Multicopper oxidase n=1 Tax=Geodermatophilus amargosae TaxID=1296565 RepID=A0A1I7CNL2_9ACTN|nr:multicopper oxidase domain-containing protein [Geodermatophilus amargosae]SFU00939.1 Multicopper oxidase [Geodermatophilus amargosae]